jgi:hypothetical protein
MMVERRKLRFVVDKLAGVKRVKRGSAEVKGFRVVMGDESFSL